MQTEQRRADDLRFGDRVLDTRGRCCSVTSTRLQGVGRGTVSVGFAGLEHRVSYRPSDQVAVGDRSASRVARFVLRVLLVGLGVGGGRAVIAYGLLPPEWKRCIHYATSFFKATRFPEIAPQTPLDVFRLF